jgi:UTP--glucose-1-phosphate uridylyltransferase
MIKKAVIPAAGLGTRFLPATKAQPKEMLPVVDTPVIQYVVQEALDAGLLDILIITGKGKRAIADHFDRNHELESHLKGRQGPNGIEEMRRLADMANIHFVRQKEFRGLGDAIRYARYHTGDEPFAVLLGDTILDSVMPVTRQLIDVYEQYRRPILAVEEVETDKVSRYGIAGGTRISDRILDVEELVEKPEPDEAPSNLAIAGRYILTPTIYGLLDETLPGKGGEVQLTDALRMLPDRERPMAFTIEGKRYDIGNKLDFLKTNVEFALMRDEFAAPMLEFLKSIVEEGAEEG